MSEFDKLESAPPRRDRAFPLVEQHTVVYGVSDDFKEIINDALGKIPDSAIRAIQEYGYQLEIGPTLLDLRPDLKVHKPRGYQSGKTFENTNGFHDPNLKRIYVFEYFKPEVLSSKLAKNLRGEAVFRHEIGHALDRALGQVSNSDWFLAAYDRDFENLLLNESMKDELARHAYYLQADDAGRKETFAELFAILTGGGSDRVATLKTAFPNSYDVMQEWMRRLK